jgi:hypothetical protein
MTYCGKCVWITVTGVIQHFVRHACMVMTDERRTSMVCAECQNGLMGHNADWHGNRSNLECDHTGDRDINGATNIAHVLINLARDGTRQGWLSKDVEC